MWIHKLLVRNRLYSNQYNVQICKSLQEISAQVSFKLVKIMKSWAKFCSPRFKPHNNHMSLDRIIQEYFNPAPPQLYGCPADGAAIEYPRWGLACKNWSVFAPKNLIVFPCPSSTSGRGSFFLSAGCRLNSRCGVRAFALCTRPWMI